MCGDMKARKAEQDDYTRVGDLQDFLMSQRRVLTFPRGASAIRLPLLARGEMRCWSSAGLLNY